MQSNIVTFEKNQLKDFWLRQFMLEGAFVGFLFYNALLLGGFMMSRFMPGLSSINDVLVLSGMMFSWGALAGFVLMPFGAMIGAMLAVLYTPLLTTLETTAYNPLAHRKAYDDFAKWLTPILCIVVFVLALVGMIVADSSRFGFNLQTVMLTLLFISPILLLMTWRLNNLHQTFVAWYFGGDGRKRKTHEQF